MTAKIRSGLDYRADIDGLRAVAVCAVIAFHAGADWFPGGFLGVDVFFVISGYLITKILLRDAQPFRQMISSFYSRRFRRILPALLVVIIGCFPVAWAVMTPLELKDFAQSVLATLVFVSNIHFLDQSGYFEQASEMMPLVHTWSLAVEEQFYILFPFVIFLLRRFSDRWAFFIVSILAVSSFVFSQMYMGWDQDAAFFIFPTRAWELLAGSQLAILSSGSFFHSENRVKPVYADLLAGAGLGLIFGVFLVGTGGGITPDG